MMLTPNWLVAPVVIPMIFAALGLMRLRRNQSENLSWQRNLAIVGTILNLAISLAILHHTLTVGRISLQVGDWQAPFGITLLADGLTGIMLSLTAILSVTIVPFSIKTLDERRRLNFYPLLLFLVMGVNGAFLAGDLFNLYVFFEVLLMASFVLLTMGGQMRQINGGIRYVVLNLLASTLFLAAAGVAYGTLGTLNMAHLAQRLDGAPEHVRLLMAGLLLVAFGSKAGLFPLFFWLPSSYHTPHPVVTAFFGGLLTKVGIYTLFRIFPLFFPDLLVAWQPLLLWMAGFTMLVGVLGAIAATTIRRVLSFHIISHVGFMIMGLGVAMSGNKLAVGFGMAAAILYLAHHMIVKTALLMAGGTVELEMGSGNLTNGKLGRADATSARVGRDFLLGGHVLGRHSALQRLRQQTQPAGDHPGHGPLVGGRGQRSGQPLHADEHGAPVASRLLGHERPARGRDRTAFSTRWPMADLGTDCPPGRPQPDHGHLRSKLLSLCECGRCTGVGPPGLYCPDRTDGRDPHY